MIIPLEEGTGNEAVGSLGLFKVIILSLISVLSLTNCTTTTKLIKHGELEVQTKMSSTVFLDPISDDNIRHF